MAKKNKVCKVSQIGGQAVLEGVMMRGPSTMATAVRNPEGHIVIESKRFVSNSSKSVWYRIPIIRGVLNFVSSMVMGIKTLMGAADVWIDVEDEQDNEPSKFEQWLSKKTKIDVMDIAVTIGLILGLALSIGLFFILPTFLTGLLFKIPAFSSSGEIVRSLVEGVLRLVIFVSYILIVSLMPDIKRTFMYHGAEHRVISCYEHDLELNVKNAQSMSTVHDRCGTTFMFIVMVIAIIVVAAVSAIGGSFGELMASNIFFRILIRLLLLPLIAGVSYELLKLFAKSNNILFRICKAPGLLLQKLTTKKPTDDMVEVAIAAFNMVMDMEADATINERKYDESFKKYYNTSKQRFVESNIDIAELDWILVDVMGVERSKIATIPLINSEQKQKAEEYIERRLKGEPVQYIVGSTEFFGIKLLVRKNVLIPRFDTEYVAECAINTIGEMEYKTVLDMCTGSGAIAIAIAKNTEAMVTMSDISKEALELARENAILNELDINAVESDMFTNITEKYDLIVCNPPYISEEEMQQLDSVVKDNEPSLALYGGVDGLDYYRIISDKATDYLNDNGSLVLEIGHLQAQSVVDLLSDRYSVQILKDLSQNDRIVLARKVK